MSSPAILTQIRHNSTEPLSASSTPLDIDASALLDAPAQIGYLHALGLDFGYGITSSLMWVMEHLHVTAGLPWWAAIAALPVIFRIAIFKGALTAAEASAKMNDLKNNPKYNEAMGRMKAAAAKKDGQMEMMAARSELTQLQKDLGISIGKTLWPLLQVPFAVCSFRLLRTMAALPVPGFESAGLLWFQDLTVPDPLYILPLASAGIMYLIMKTSLKYMDPKQQTTMKLLQYVLTPLSIIFTINFAADVQWFFLISAVMQWAQSWLFYQPWLRRAANLPPLQVHLPTGAPGTGAAAASPFATMSQTAYQAPRTVNTTARPAGQQADAAGRMDTSNPITNIRNTYRGVVDKAKDKMQENAQSRDSGKAQEYEERRALEEQERMYRRREEARLRRAEKKGRQ